MKRNMLTMNRTLLIAMLIIFIFPLFGLANVVRAQSDAACEIDLTALAADLFSAQSLAGSGDLDGGLSLVGTLREQLRTIREACEAVGVTAEAVLDGTYTAPNGTFRLDYPRAWIVGNFSTAPNGGGVVFANSQSAVAAMSSRMPVLNPRQQATILSVTTPDVYGIVPDENNVIGSVIAQFGEQGLAPYTRSEAVIDEDGNFATMLFTAAGAEGVADVEGELLVSRLEDGRFAFMIALTPPGEYAALRPIAVAMTRSVN